MNAQDKEELDNRIFRMVIRIVCIILIGLLIWAYSIGKNPHPYGYRAAWQPCSPVDTTYTYLESITTTEGPIYNAVGCPVEIDAYVNFRPVVEHSKIEKE